MDLATSPRAFPFLNLAADENILLAKPLALRRYNDRMGTHDKTMDGQRSYFSDQLTTIAHWLRRTYLL